MAAKRPKTVAEYIAAAPKVGQPHLRRLRAILREVAPGAAEVLKWNTPFFIEPRFLFSYAAFKEHVSLTVGQAVLAEFAGKTGDFATTRNFLKVRYDQALPEALIRRMAKRQLQLVRARDDDGFW